MAISEAYAGTRTTAPVEASETVLNTTTPETTDGIYQIFIDVSALALGDTLEIRIKEKAGAATTQRVIFAATLTHAQGADSAMWVSPSLIFLHGWDVTLKQTAGSARALPWSIRRVA